MCASSGLDQVSNGLLGHEQNQFPPKLSLHRIQNTVCKYCHSTAATGSEFSEEWLLHCHPHQQPCPSSRGCGGTLCPVVSTSHRDTAVTTRLGVLWLFKLELWEKLGTANGEIKKFNKQNRQSLRNASDPSALKFTGCANTVRKPFP